MHCPISVMPSWVQVIEAIINQNSPKQFMSYRRFNCDLHVAGAMIWLFWQFVCTILPSLVQLLSTSYSGVRRADGPRWFSVALAISAVSTFAAVRNPYEKIASLHFLSNFLNDYWRVCHAQPCTEEELLQELCCPTCRQQCFPCIVNKNFQA